MEKKSIWNQKKIKILNNLKKKNKFFLIIEPFLIL